MIIDFFAPRLLFSVREVFSIFMIQGHYLREITRKEGSCLLLSTSACSVAF